MELDSFYLVKEPGRCYVCNTPIDAGSGINTWEAAENWLSPTGACLACASAGFCGQIPNPGDCCFGLFDGAEFPTADPIALTLLYSSAAFWAGVWENREGGEPRRPEDATAERLTEIAQCFDAGEWPKGAALLEPVANRWMQETGRELWCWRADNLAAVTRCWRRLERHLFSLLPEPVRLLADCRRYSWRYADVGCAKGLWGL